MPQNSPAKIDENFFQYEPAFLNSAEADRLVVNLWQNLEWTQHKIKLFGRKVRQPRLSAFYGAAEAQYFYSGLQLEPTPWLPALFDLNKRLEKLLLSPFNSVLANAYRDGNDSMGWHSDNEIELGPDPLVASISLGAERRFLVRKAGASHSTGLWLEHGSLLLMKRGCQQAYQHSLPKTQLAIGLRINLTFRQISNQLPP